MAFGIDDAVAAASKLIDDGINKIWPDPQDKAKADAITIKATADAAIAQMQTAMSVMLAEAQSSDPWTSRARPSFLYVVYVLILFSLPMGVLFAFKPDVARAVIEGFHGWLAAIPDTYITLFGTVMLGYGASRTIEKIKGVAK